MGPIRLNCAKIQESKRFGQVVMILILFSCFSLALEGPQDAQSGFVARYLGPLFAVINLLVLTAFIVEGSLKVIVHGFCRVDDQGAMVFADRMDVMVPKPAEEAEEVMQRWGVVL